MRLKLTFTALHASLLNNARLTILKTALRTVVWERGKPVLRLEGLHLVMESHRIGHMHGSHSHIHHLHSKGRVVGLVWKLHRIIKLSHRVWHGVNGRGRSCWGPKGSSTGLQPRQDLLVTTRLLFTSSITSRQLTTMAIAYRTGRNSAQAGIVVVELLLSLSLGRSNVRHHSIGLLQCRNVVS